MAALAIIVAATAGYFGTTLFGPHEAPTHYVMVRGDQFTVFRMNTETGAIDTCELGYNESKCRPVLAADTGAAPPTEFTPVR